jgi:hypothetical protein
VRLQNWRIAERLVEILLTVPTERMGESNKDMFERTGDIEKEPVKDGALPGIIAGFEPNLSIDTDGADIRLIAKKARGSVLRGDKEIEVANRRGHNEGTYYRDLKGWRVQISLPDGRRRSFQAKTEPEARRLLKQARNALAAGRLNPNTRQTVEQFLTAWLDGITGQVKEKTLYCYELNAKRLIRHIREDTLECPHTPSHQAMLSCATGQGRA